LRTINESERVAAAYLSLTGTDTWIAHWPGRRAVINPVDAFTEHRTGESEVKVREEALSEFDVKVAVKVSPSK
jgi:hypothetical protein